jgi:hypothetical protein
LADTSNHNRDRRSKRIKKSRHSAASDEDPESEEDDALPDNACAEQAAHDREDLKKQSHHLAAMYYPWFSDPSGGTINETYINPEYDEKERFNTKMTENAAQGELQDILKLLPATYSEIVVDNGRLPRWLYKVVSRTFLREWSLTSIMQISSGMGSQRSNMAHRVRKEAGPEIFNCSVMDLLESKRRNTARNRCLIGLTEASSVPSSDEYDFMNIELLHKPEDWDGGSGKLNVNSVFLNPILIKVGHLRVSMVRV